MKNQIIFIVVFLFFGCEVTELRDPTLVVPSKDMISLFAVDANFNTLSGKQTLLADSNSICLIKVLLESKSDGTEEIVFSTTSGVFTTVGQAFSTTSQNTITLTPDDRELIIQLNTLDIPNKNVLVSATSGKISSVLEFTFGTAYPTNFQISPQNTSVLKTEEVEFTVNAFAGEGTMSENQYMEISTTSDDGILLDHPQFVKIVNQKATFKVLNRTQIPGKVKVTVDVPISADSTLKKDVSIIYN
ncbi:hypothetical protein [Algoriphagus terrigena]|uniref:hypothetical protein n=1 Tax=Algoriphagus terrigena TaxID=344884 RepID=UPI000413D7D3|nr:hypothetical protein [Algoriphagus terrigena]